MTVELEPTTTTPPVMEIHVTGKLEAADYERFVPAVETFLKEHGKARLLVWLNNFEGWSAGALWEDIKFDAKHFNDIDRLAIVGDKRSHKGMAVFCTPFTTAKVRFFPLDEIVDAREWLGESE